MNQAHRIARTLVDSLFKELARGGTWSDHGRIRYAGAGVVASQHVTGGDVRPTSGFYLDLGFEGKQMARVVVGVDPELLAGIEDFDVIGTAIEMLNREIRTRKGYEARRVA